MSHGICYRRTGANPLAQTRSWGELWFKRGCGWVSSVEPNQNVMHLCKWYNLVACGNVIENYAHCQKMVLEWGLVGSFRHLFSNKVFSLDCLLNA